VEAQNYRIQNAKSMKIVPVETQSTIFRYIELEKQIWRELNLLLDIRMLKDKLKANARESGESLSDDFAKQKAKDIQFCLKQAKDYFFSSKNATLITKPTLIFYGLVSLTASLIIFKKRDKSLNSMRESHGLKDIYPDALKQINEKNISKEKLLEISAEIQDSGTFVELAGIDLFERFKLNIKREGKADSSKDFKQCLNFKQLYPDLKTINLLSLFQNTPEIWKETIISLRKDSNVVIGDANVSDNGIVIRFSKELCPLENLKHKFTFINQSKYAESNDYHFFTIEKECYTKHTPLTKSDITGVHFLTANQNNPLIVSDLILYYLTFFILGSISRYKPALWRFILDDSLHGLNTIPEILCESAYIKMPLSILSEFNDNYYKY